MVATPSMEKVEFFLRNVFDYLDRYTEFTERPMADENHWIGVNAPIVQLIFLDDVPKKRHIEAHYVTLFVNGQVFTIEQYVDACVKVLQSLREEDLPDVVIEYTNMLVEVYAQSAPIMKPASSEGEAEAIRAAAEEASKPELDYEAAIEVKPALGEEEKPISEPPVEEETTPVPSPGSEEARGWQ